MKGSVTENELALAEWAWPDTEVCLYDALQKVGTAKLSTPSVRFKVGNLWYHFSPSVSRDSLALVYPVLEERGLVDDYFREMYVGLCGGPPIGGILGFEYEAMLFASPLAQFEAMLQVMEDSR